MNLDFQESDWREYQAALWQWNSELDGGGDAEPDYDRIRRMMH
jgi:hypothetical protein